VSAASLPTASANCTPRKRSLCALRATVRELALLMLVQVLAQAHAHHVRLQAETGPLVLAFEEASEALKDGDLSLAFLPAPLKLVAERRQRAVIDKSIQAAQQARGRSERGALAGAAAAPLCRTALTSSSPTALQPSKACAPWRARCASAPAPLAPASPSAARRSRQTAGSCRSAIV
jgi:hypothetical protein